MEAESYSFVIPVYYGETAANFRQCFHSCINQTILPKQICIAVDGSIPSSLEDLLFDFSRLALSRGIQLVITRSTINSGAGAARNLAAAKVTAELIALIDSDDINLTNRIERQLIAYKRHSADVVCSHTLESDFDASSGSSVLKSCPEYSPQISNSLMYSCPIANPSVLIKKTAWDAVGGFPPYQYSAEDHLFFLRLLKSGFQFYCVQEPLVKVRVNRNHLQRRVGFKILISDIKFRLDAFSENLIGFFPLIVGIAAAFLRRMLPGRIQYFVTRIFRKIALSISTITKKRTLDLSVLLVFSVPLLFIFVIIYLFMICTGRRKIFYSSERHVFGESETATILKFRSMVLDAESLLNSSTKYTNQLETGFTDVSSDYHVYTKTGRILEKFKLVELPELLHVLTGTLSLVGNRALPLSQSSILLKNFPDLAPQRLLSRAGIFGPIQCVGRQTVTPLERLKLEVAYSTTQAYNYRISIDIGILWWNLLSLLRLRRFSYQDVLWLLKSK